MNKVNLPSNEGTTDVQILEQDERDLDDDSGKESLRTSRRNFIKGAGLLVGGGGTVAGSMALPDEYSSVEDGQALVGLALVGVGLVVAGAAGYYAASRKANAETKLGLRDELYSNAIQEESQRQKLTSKPEQVDYISRTLIGDAIIKAVTALNNNKPRSEARNIAVEHLHEKIDTYVNNVIQMQNQQVLSFLDDVESIDDFDGLNYEEAWGMYATSDFMSGNEDENVTVYKSDETQTDNNENGADSFAHVPVEWELPSGMNVKQDALVFIRPDSGSILTYPSAYTALATQSGSQITDDESISEGFSTSSVSNYDEYRSVTVSNPYDGGSGSASYLKPTEYETILTKIQTIRENARSDFYGIVDDIYNNYSPGELDPSNLQLPTNRLLNTSESYLDGNDQAQQILSYTLGHTSTSSDSTDKQTWSWTDSDGNTKTVDGFLVTDKQIGELNKGDTVDLTGTNIAYADIFEPTTSGATKKYNVKGGIITFEGAVDVDGNEVTTIDATSNPVTKQDVSDLRNKLDELQQDRANQDAKVSLDVGGIGGALFDGIGGFGDAVAQYGPIVGGIVGLVVVLNLVSN